MTSFPSSPPTMNDFNDLVAHLCGLDPDEDHDIDQLDEALMAAHNINTDDLEIAVKLLLPCTMPLRGPLTDQPHHCFGIYDPKTGVFRALVKQSPLTSNPVTEKD